MELLVLYSRTCKSNCDAIASIAIRLGCENLTTKVI